MILPSPEEFKIVDCVIGGDDCIFISAKNITCKWTEDNLHFRSIIIRKDDHKVINCSYKKFFNWSEQPDLSPFPLKNFTAVDKMDGSTLIFGIHNDQIIHRTRGTLNCEKLDNGYEIHFLKNKYPKLWEGIKDNPTLSILTEWETPNNYIVLRRVNEPTLTLTGIIDNETLQYLPQSVLDTFAKLWEIDRPTYYKYTSISECIEDVTAWNNREGVVLYSEDGQQLRKIKSDQYLSMHKIMHGLNSLDSVIDLFLSTSKFTDYKYFYDHVKEIFDFEVAEKIKDDMRLVVDAYNQFLIEYNKVAKVVSNVSGELFTRKDQAIHILQHYNDYRKTLAFMFLDNKLTEDKIIKTAILTHIN
jgi:T4 RnlA family RNA ligase